MTDGIVIPARFGSPTERARQAFSEDLARLVIPYLGDLGWQTVVNDVLTVAAGFIAQESKEPVKDLTTASEYLRRYDWRRAKRLYFAAKQGIRPEQVTDEMLENKAPPNPDGR